MDFEFEDRFRDLMKLAAVASANGALAAAADPGEKLALVGADANAAAADKPAIRPPSAVTPTIALTSRLARRCS